MPDRIPFTRHRDARALDAYWDAVIEATPADPLRLDAIDKTDALVVRRAQALATAPQPDRAFTERLLASLLGSIPESGPAPIGRGHVVPVQDVVPAALPETSSAPALWRQPWWNAPLNIAAALLIVLLSAWGLWHNWIADPTPLPQISFDANDIALEWQTGSAAGFSAAICDVAVSDQGLVYVVDCVENNIKVFDDDGNLVDTWGTYGIDPGQFRFGTPERNQGGIDLDADGNVYVFDTGNDRVQKFSPNHEFIREWGNKGNGAGEFLGPLGAVDRQNGRVYVADSGNSRVQVFDLDGTYLDQWGERGDLNGQFQTPMAVAIGGDGTVYVADPDAQRIQHFDPTGVYLGEIDDPGAVTGVAVYPDGHLVAASPDQGRLLIFRPDGTILDTISAVEGAGALIAPQRIALDEDGRLYILVSGGAYEQRPGYPSDSDTAPSRVVKIDLPDLASS